MPGRRTVLLAAAGAALTACSGSSGTTSSGTTNPSPGTTAPPQPPQPSSGGHTATPSAGVPSSTGSPSGSASAARLPTVPAWQPSPGDVQPAAKRAAVAAVQTRLRRTGAGSVVEVLDAQYGGILASSASVLVVCRQWTAGPDGGVATGGTTVDVRLMRSGGDWQVTAFYPARPGAPAARLSAVATRVLAGDRIALPPASYADVRSGLVHDSVLTAMLAVADRYRIGISVIRSGHPLYVFGTTRPSYHPRGRAFDTWQIDGHAVVDPATPRALVTGYMEAVAEAGSYNVGGPYRLSGGTFFSDATHHDHVHAGFTT